MVSKKKNNKKRKQILSSSKPISKNRLWAFRIIAMVILPLILFACLELGLRLIGFGYPSGAIIQTEVDYPQIYHDNYKFGWRFFPKNIARNFNSFSFDARKTPQAYRIFVLGASAAAGVPEPIYNFGRFIEIMLEDQYPQTKFEVVTVAMPAINSHAVLPIARDCAKYDPDLFIVYLGNNEVVGPFGPGTVFSPMSPSLSMIRANIAAKSTRTGQLLEQVLESVVPRGKKPQRWGGMEMFLDKQVPYDSPALESVYTFYEQNLRDICTAGLSGGAKIVVSNVGVNLKDSPPFASLHREDLTEAEKQQWEELYQQGIEQETAGQLEQAIENYLAAEIIDETFADLQFRLGKCLWNTGQYENAQKRYRKAKEYDTLRFRADTKINTIIRDVATKRESEGVYFVDSVAVLETNSPHGTPGNELFYEHVHYRPEGNYIIAKTMVEKIKSVLPPKIKQTSDNAPLLTLKQCKDRLVLTGYEEYQIARDTLTTMIKKPPFTNQLYHIQRVDELEGEIEALGGCTKKPYLAKAVSCYHQTISERPTDWKLRHKLGLILLKGLENPDLAINEFKEVLTFLPDYLTYSYLVLVLERQEKYAEAAQFYRHLLKSNIEDANVYHDYADVLRKKGDHKQAITYYNKALKFYPMHSLDAYTSLASSYNQLGKKKKAVNVLRKALESFPKDAPCDDLILFPLLVELGQTQLAVDHYQQVLEVKPDHLPVLNNLAWTLAAHPNDAIRDPAKAVRYAQISCELTERKQAKVLDTLAVAYAANGNFHMAAVTAQKAAALATQEDNSALAQRIQKRLRLYQSGKMYIDSGLK
jgi:tetratricopeptide (TPR) repeat protein